MAKLYTCTAIEKIFDLYRSVNGEIIELIPGTLGYGLTICMADGYYPAVIKEVPVSSWASAHTVRQYKTLPKKYQQMIDDPEYVLCKPVWCR